MKGIEFPIFKTKIKGERETFNLIDPEQSRKYFKLKAGSEIEKLRSFLKSNTFLVILLGKKNSGKGTYSKLFTEIIDPERIEHFSIGDMVRSIDGELAEGKKKKELIKFLKKNYRGRLSLDEIIYDLENRDTITLRPTELILALAKREVGKREKKALFVDGFPRDLDQISYSLFFRDLIGYRDDPDVFILIDVPESVIDERIKHRVVCPRCQSTRNLKLHLVKKENIKYDEKKKEFYFICDNPDCSGIKMVKKEGDELGIKPIRERLKKDAKLIEQAFSLYGIPKILLRNSVPVELARGYVDDYEITPEYDFHWNEKKKEVEIIEKPWIFLDDQGVPSYSLLPQALVISLIKQMVDVLNL